MDSSPIQYSSSELSSVPFRLAGKNCVLRTHSRELRSLLSAAEGTVPGDVSGFELVVEIRRGIRQHSPGAAHFRGLNHLVFALFGDEVFIFDLKRRQVHAAVSFETSQNREFWTRTLLPIALGTLGLAIGVVPLHSACVDSNGSGLLIAGVSGSGKSILAVALAKTGLKLASDDWTYLCESDRGLVAYGVNAPVKLLPDAITFFAEVGMVETKLSLNGELAYEVDASRELNLQCAMRCVPKALLLLHRVDSPGIKIQPRGGEVIRTYFERSAEKMPAGLNHLGELRSRVIGSVAALPCYTLECGVDPRAAAEFVSNWWKEQQ